MQVKARSKVLDEGFKITQTGLLTYPLSHSQKRNAKSCDSKGIYQKINLAVDSKTMILQLT